MPELVDGLWLQQYVEPQLLEEFRNMKDDFVATIPGAPAAAIDKDGIRFNKLINEIAFHVNKGTDFEPVEVPAKKSLIEWDKLDTDLTEVTDAELRALAFNKDSELRRLHRESYRIGVRNYIMDKLAPEENADGKMPVLRTTGAAVNGRLKLTYNDLLTFLTEVEGLNLNNRQELYMILCAEHRQDIIEDRANTQNIRDVEIDKNTGEIKRLFKMKFFENNHNVTYDDVGVKKALGAAAEGTDRNASVFYYAPNTVFHLERIKTLYKPLEQDTRSADPKSEFRLHGYGLCDKKQEHGFGAIISGIDPG